LLPVQLDFQTSPKYWCIAGIVEHVVLVEDAVLARVFQELSSDANPGSE
jgi:hypothetical protein